jgi:hypothetical protein
MWEFYKVCSPAPGPGEESNKVPNKLIFSPPTRRVYVRVHPKLFSRHGCRFPFFLNDFFRLFSVKIYNIGDDDEPQQQQLQEQKVTDDCNEPPELKKESDHSKTPLK